MKAEMRLKTKSVKVNDKKKFVKLSASVRSENVRDCFNCGEDDHLSRECHHKHKGQKCFKCQGFGYVAAICPAKPDEKKIAYASCRRPREKQLKDVEIGNRQYSAVIDTGSELSLLMDCLFRRV
ncbi:uncharacterized protein LOC135164262 isoform X2 [Diachasmimorpha longicaudata]|uniref:uncharacterized protein LOC135164262 isoform X2 n=1 Tax=Diachasmimorpha longicaudata TaxID=58733 RepID=UPI0030B8E65C